LSLTTLNGEFANRDNFEKSLAKEKIVYALACDSLEVLGKTAVEQGTKAYIGYKARFMLVID